MLWATTRRAEAARAAATSVPDTSRRSRLVASKPRFAARGLTDCGRLVSWLMTTSGRAAWTARRTEPGSKASPTAGTTPGTPRAATRASCAGEHGHLVPGRGQRRHQGPADGSRASRDEDPHGPDAMPVRRAPVALAGWTGERAQRLPRCAPGVVRGPGRRPGPTVVGRVRVDGGDRAAPAPPAAAMGRRGGAAGAGVAGGAVGRGVRTAERVQHHATGRRRALDRAGGTLRRGDAGCLLPRQPDPATGQRGPVALRRPPVPGGLARRAARHHATAVPRTRATASPPIGLLVGVLTLAAVVVACIWQHRAASAGRALGIPSRRSPAWGVGSWFVPIVNLWMPYSAVRDCLPPDHPYRPRVLQWWVAWLLAAFLSAAAGASALVSTGVAPGPVRPGRAGVPGGHRLGAGHRGGHRGRPPGRPGQCSRREPGSSGPDRFPDSSSAPGTPATRT